MSQLCQDEVVAAGLATLVIDLDSQVAVVAPCTLNAQPRGLAALRGPSEAPFAQSLSAAACSNDQRREARGKAFRHDGQLAEHRVEHQLTPVLAWLSLAVQLQEEEHQ